MPLLGYVWGSTAAEQAAPYPCDALMPDPQQVAYRAIEVAAPAALVWRWLCQLRVAPYSYDWIDNWGRRSPRELTPGLEQLEVGQRALAFFEIAGFEVDRSITLLARRSVFGRLALSYCVSPSGLEHSRLTVKLAVVYPRGIGWCLRRVPPLGDLLMMRKQLRTIKRLAERDHRRRPG